MLTILGEKKEVILCDPLQVQRCLEAKSKHTKTEIKDKTQKTKMSRTSSLILRKIWNKQAVFTQKLGTFRQIFFSQYLTHIKEDYI